MKMFPKIVTGVIGMAAAIAFSTSNAQANLLVNGGFDSAAGFTANPITLSTVDQGWASSFGPNASVQSSLYYESPGYSLQVTEGAATWNPAGTYQVVSGVTVGQTYNLTVDILAPVALTSTYATPIDIQLQFFDASLVNLSTTETGWSAIGTVGQWTQYSVTATAPANAVYAAPYLMFMESGNQTTSDYLYFDNASLTAVPEPATIALLGMGLSLPLYLIRRRK
jgi:PEP-CTERM motif